MKGYLGFLVILSASIIWAFEPVLAKFAYNSSADFIEITASRSLFAALTAFFYYLIKSKSLTSFALPNASFFKLFLIAIINVVFSDLLYFYAIKSIPVVNAVLIAHLQPLFIIFLGYFLLKNEKPQRYDYLGVIFMILAGLFVSTKNFANLLSLKIATFSDLLVLLATLGWAATTILTKKYLSHLDSGLITFYRFSFGFLFLLAFLHFQPVSIFSNIYQIILGFLTGVGYIFYYEGLKRLKAVQVSALELSSPFFAALIGFLFLQELITPFQSLGMLSLVFGIYFLAKKS